MNRLAPLITRAATLRPLPARSAFAMTLPAPLEPGARWQDDLQFFLTAWLGGLLFVGTLLS
jgi:hypothetical protein